MIKIGVIGYGYWGPNLVRNFLGVPNATVTAVSDLSLERLKQAQNRYPAIKLTKVARELIDDPDIDAIAIATPVATHFDLATQVLKAGKHVWVEKPLAGTTEHCSRLIDEAARRRLVLMVDHTFVYHGAVRKIKSLLDDGKLGRPYYYDSVRVNLGLFQHDINVLWDLAVHDLSILDYILGKEPRSVAATGIAHIHNEREDIAYLTCFFDDKLLAHFHVNWLAPVKIRRTLVAGDRRMVVYDDLEPDEKIKVYDKGLSLSGKTDSIHQRLVGYRAGDMWAPKLDATEALQIEAAHFVACILKSLRPLTDGESGLRIVRILEAADKSLKNGGKPVDIGRRWK